MNIPSTSEVACQKFGGKMVKGVCMVDGYPMAPSKNIFAFHPESQTYEKWSPDKFLRLTGWKGPQWKILGATWAGRRPLFSNKSLKSIKKMIRNKKPLDVPWIHRDVDRGFSPQKIGSTIWVPEHEGRHRALAAEQLGLPMIPVVVYHTKQGYCVPVTATQELKGLLK